MSPTTTGGGDPSATNRSQFGFSIAVAVTLGLVGCLTLAILLAALFGGMWLDEQFENSKPVITVALLIASVPLTLVVMFWVVRKITTRYLPQKITQDHPAQEDVHRE